MNKKRIKLKKESFKLKVRDMIALILLIIILVAFLIIIQFNKHVTPRILSAAEMRLNNMTSIIVHKTFEKDVLDRDLLEDIITVNVSMGEIQGADFNYDKIYELAAIISDSFNYNFNLIETGQLESIGYYDSDAYDAPGEGYIMALPIGIASKNVYLANLGPKIPVRVKFVGTVLTSVRTKITDYGINNALIEVFLDIEIERQIITPVVFETTKIPYSMPISSKIIYGKVPEFYAGIMSKESAVNIPIVE